MTTAAALATVDCRVCQKPWTPTREQPRLTHPDCAPDPRSELLAEITHAIRSNPRSLQRRIGPSEIGHPCLRRVAYTLGGYPEVNSGDVNWKATIGTAVHSWLADVFDKADWALRTTIGAVAPAGGDDGVRQFTSLDEAAPPRWLVEEKVNTGTLNGDDIDGSTDLFDTWTGTVIDWKGLSLDTPLPTPTGWTTMGAIQPGDTVIGADGAPRTVTGKSPIWHRPCYRMTFDTGESIVTDNVHEWPMVVGHDPRRYRTELLSTEDAADIVKTAWGAANLRIDNTPPLHLPPAELTVDPYVLGAWLGDGASQTGLISKPDDGLFREIESRGYLVGPVDSRGLTRRIVGLTSHLRAIGVLGDKHIPQQYLRGSVRQRLDLLRGLMDTDGHWNKKRSRAVFTTVDKQRAHDVADLVHSLGWKAHIAELTKKGFGLTVTAYDVEFTPHDMNPFLLPRKAALVRLAGSSRSRRRVVTSIERVPTVATQCIEVDGDHTYLCGDGMIPTHNCVGPRALSGYRRTFDNSRPVREIALDPKGQQYACQAQDYGRGWVAKGYEVRNVAVFFLPRDGKLHEGHLWMGEYNPAIPEWFYQRAEPVAQLMQALPREQHHPVLDALPTADAFCTMCPFYKHASMDLTLGCPGDPNLGDWRQDSAPAIDDFVTS